MMIDRPLKTYHSPSLCIGLILKGRWQTAVNGKFLNVSNVGIPTILAAGEDFEAVTMQEPSQRFRMAALNIEAGFLASGIGEDEDSFHTLSTLLKLDVLQQELPACEILRSILQRLYDNPYRGPLGRLYAESLALSAIVELAVHLRGERSYRKILPSHHDLAQEAREILDRDIASVPSIGDLARHMGMSQVTLRRVFKAAFGITIFEYVRNRKLDAARIMLREGRFQVAEVSYRVGYPNPANFATAYRRRFGHPPTIELKRFKI
jgi:AraC-like DNA-binding protein